MSPGKPPLSDEDLYAKFAMYQKLNPIEPGPNSVQSQFGPAFAGPNPMMHFQDPAFWKKPMGKKMAEYMQANGMGDFLKGLQTPGLGRFGTPGGGIGALPSQPGPGGNMPPPRNGPPTPNIGPPVPSPFGSNIR